MREYAFIYDTEITRCGFIQHPTIKMAGASPDGLIDEDGLIEIKCPRSTNHMRFIIDNEIKDETFICSKTNKKLVKESFGDAFREACYTAGIKKSAHGLRKLAATRAANSGATVSQLKALFGWTNDAMASLYTKSADRKRLALEAIKKLQKS